ncbi:hypothetical protein B0H15DRAFT_851594 [Mycena belliarum]|uniref:Uncharacterized protein n=1 Tax=Mycena belliarum TaxID=1033014 RepID=A0AAD6U3B3_9AGAR|nr:hypothetical protein B0H15DRAFT_851594 [Mycena belliae]
MSIEEFGPPPVARTDADLLGPRAKKDRRLWGIGAPGEVSLLAGWEGIQLPPLKRSEYPGAEDSEVVSVAAAEDAEVMEAATAAGTECCQADEATGAAEETDKEQVEATTGQQDVADVFTLAPMNEEMRSIARYATRLSHDTMSAGLRRPRERIQLGLLKPTGATRNALKKVGPLPKKVAPPVVKLQQVLDATSHAQATTKKTAAAGVGPVLKGKENGRLTSTAPNTLPPSAVPSMGPPSAIPGRTRAPSADPTVTARPSNIRPPSRATRPPTFVLRPPGTAAPPARLAHAAPRAPSPAVPPAAAPPPASLIAPRGRYTTAEKGKGRAP